MEMCRACLGTGKGMTKMDDNFLYKYNILTSLNLLLTEDMPLYTCKACFDGVEYCIEFRNKCIASEQAIKGTTLEAKHAPNENKSENIIPVKMELKVEYDEDSLDSYSEPCTKYDDDDDDYLELPKICTNKGKQKNVTKIDKPLPVRKNKQEKKYGCKINCMICTEKFKDDKELAKHLDNHKLSVPCAQCSESFVNLPHLLGHRIEHLPDKKKRCHMCSKKFNIATGLEFHYMRVHELAEKDTPIQCKKCLATFGSGVNLHAHMRRIHSDVKFKCEHCTLGFGRKIQLMIHMNKHGQNKRYECDLCDYSSKYSGGVAAHKLRKHTEGRVYCKTCKSVFPSQSLLDKHICKNSLNLICPVCGVFIKKTSESSIKNHMMTHDEVLRYKCDKCPSKFKWRSNFRIHMDKHAGTPRHKCETCLRSFYELSVLTKHRRTHTGEKPYVCTICSRGFTGRHNLKVHMKVHGIMNLINKKNSSEPNTQFKTVFK